MTAKTTMLKIMDELKPNAPGIGTLEDLNPAEMSQKLLGEIDRLYDEHILTDQSAASYYKRMGLRVKLRRA